MHQQIPKRLSLVLLGDQTINISPPLKKLLQGSRYSIAQSEFIRNTSIALRAQVDRLHHFQREHLPSFQNVHDLVAIYYESNGDCHPAISSVLLCITQLLQIFK